MLQELAITDFAIIQAVRLRFAPGLVIFTGETGAGKSIVLDAIGALLGERVGADVVRAGSPRAVIEGIFTLPWLAPSPGPIPGRAGEGETDKPGISVGHLVDRSPLSVKQDGEGQGVGPAPDDDAEQADPQRRLIDLLREYGLEGDDDTLIVTREIAASGRSVARVNGRAVPVSVLARLGALLVDVHGQGAH